MALDATRIELWAIREGRRPLDIYHSAPDGDGARVRGVAVEGAVASERIDRFRVFRYEVRCWRDGVIADGGAAVDSPRVVSRDPVRARRVLELVGELPRPVWGRDELGTGEMWDSNSVIAWLLARAGVAVEALRPPAGGRAPGWAAGVAVARRQQGLPRPAHAGSHGPA